VSNKEDVERNTYKVQTALQYGVKIVSEEYINDCIKEGKRLDETRYLLTSPNTVSQVKEAYFTYEKTFVPESELIQRQEREKKQTLEKVAVENARKNDQNLTTATKTTPPPPTTETTSPTTETTTTNTTTESNKVIPNVRRPPSTFNEPLVKVSVFKYPLSVTLFTFYRFFFTQTHSLSFLFDSQCDYF
jgi:hypothetical protein